MIPHLEGGTHTSHNILAGGNAAEMCKLYFLCAIRSAGVNLTIRIGNFNSFLFAQALQDQYDEMKADRDFLRHQLTISQKKSGKRLSGKHSSKP